MFTGLVEETGIVERIKPTAKSIELTVRTGVTGRGLKAGGSLAVNGCCLTAVKVSPRGKNKLVRFDLLRETWKRTNLQFTEPGSLVDLERPLRASGEFGGHFVTGHIDASANHPLGTCRTGSRAGHRRAAGSDALHHLQRVGRRGRISLTVADVQKKSFRIWIIPHTYEITALQERKVGDAVNLEADLLGKYVEKFFAARNPRRDSDCHRPSVILQEITHRRLSPRWCGGAV